MSRETIALLQDRRLAMRDEEERQKRQRVGEHAGRRKRSRVREARKFYDETWTFVNMIDQKWENITADRERLFLPPCLNNSTILSPPLSGSLTQDASRILQTIFDSLLPASFWKLIQLETQTRIDAANINPATRRPRYKPLKPDDTKRYLLSILEFRALYHNVIADDYFNGLDLPLSVRTVESTRRRWGLSNGIFWRIAGHLRADISELCTIYHQSIKKWLLCIGNAVLDESLVACKSEDAPTIFISRKPHPVGLRYYLVCTALPLSKRSLPIRIIPDLGESSKLTVVDIFRKSFSELQRDLIVKRFPFNVTMDAFFSIQQLLDQDQGFLDPIRFTASWNKGRMKDFWALMFADLEIREFRICRNGRYIASAFRDQADMAVISNAFHFRERSRSLDPTPQPDPVIEPTEAEASLASSELSWICTACHGAVTTANGIKCTRAGCAFGRHLRCNPPTPISTLQFCSRSCRVQFISDLQQEETESARIQVSNATLLYLLRSPKTHLQQLCEAYSRPLLDGTVRSMAYSLAGFDSVPPIDPPTQNQAAGEELPEIVPRSLTESPSSESSSLAAESSLGATLASESNAPTATLPDDAISDPGSSSSSSSEDEGDTFLPISVVRRKIRDFSIEPHSDEKTARRQLQLLRDASLPDERERILRAQQDFLAGVARSPESSRPTLQEFYGSTMSGVDTLDRRLYELFRAPKSRNWHAISTYAILLYGVLANHAIICEIRKDPQFPWQLPGPQHQHADYDSIAFLKDLLQPLKRSLRVDG